MAVDSHPPAETMDDMAPSGSTVAERRTVVVVVVVAVLVVSSTAEASQVVASQVAAVGKPLEASLLAKDIEVVDTAVDEAAEDEVAGGTDGQEGLIGKSRPC